MNEKLEDLIKQRQKIVDECEEKVKKYNFIGYFFAFLILFPFLHYIGFIGICFIGLNMLERAKEAEYNRGIIEGIKTGVVGG